MTGPLATLAEWVAALSWDAIDDDARRDGLRQLMDAIAVILAGSTAPEARALARLEASDDGAATLIGHGRRATPEAAAFVNATAGVWHDFDSGQRFSGSHPAIHVVPAALAAAEAAGASGRATMTAIVAGCEVGARIGVAAGRLRAGLSPHGGWATLGAAAAVAKLWFDDAARIATTLEIATSLTILSS
ncbi:MAG: MmgE/PrpD family protein, partial [Dehalococcoidia bacterium]|nr:MmgE/PrpD family protein [Dehalococcoidia bacterium]